MKFIFFGSSSRPICTACSKRREACVWSDNPNALLVLPRTARAALKLSKDHKLSLPPLNEFRPKELELLHNWTTSTILTFIPGLPETQHGFQVSLPQIAFQHEFLLHATFDITSLHMNHLLPTSDYLLLARVHCQRAVLGGFDAPKGSVSPEAIVMAGLLLATYWLALPAWESTSQSYFPDVFNWISAARTCMGKVSAYHQEFLEGAFPFLPVQRYHGAPSMLTPFPDMFSNIHDPKVCPIDTEELKDPQTVATYKAALFSVIHYSWEVFMDCTVQTFTIYGFLCAVPDEFFNLFLEHRPRALIIVAHYCTLLGQLDGRFNRLPTVVTPFPDILYRIYDPQACPFDTEELEDAHTVAMYEAALTSFIHYGWDIFMEPEVQTFAIFAFICAVPDDFFKLFLERRPRALIIVAHYCTILGQFDGVWWYSWERCRHDL
ncbi:hypothetical protein DL96DRAFT_1715165 [Flagelloscypha sp. PMI_526]|nr:hypothetical protein DL96DRAFT_1715165 [Flagelloscypha sp. PMI_526]